MRRKKEKDIGKTQEFAQVVADKRIPPLILDQRWHRLFQKTGKPHQIRDCEQELNELLRRQGELNDQMDAYKKLKGKLLHSIVHNMDGTNEEMEHSLQSRILSKNQTLIEELNEKIDAAIQERQDLPNQIEEKNKELMLQTMLYCEKHSKENEFIIEKEKAWIANIRPELKEHVVKKRKCEAENKRIYQFLEGIFGMDLLHIFQISYEEYASLFGIENVNAQREHTESEV